VAANGNVVAGTNEAGGGLIYVSTNSGVNWTVATTMPATKMGSVHGIALAADGTLVATGGITNSIWRSTDNGVTWTEVETGIITGGLNLTIYRVPSSGALLTMGTGESCEFPNLYGPHVRRSTDHGLTWDLPQAAVNTVLTGYGIVGRNLLTTGPQGDAENGREFLETPTGAILACLTGQQPVWRSVDGGVTWTNPWTGLSPAPETYPTVSTGSYLAVWDPDEQLYTDQENPAFLVDRVSGQVQANPYPSRPADDPYTFVADALNGQGLMVANTDGSSAMTSFTSKVMAVAKVASWKLTFVWLIKPGDSSYTEAYLPVLEGGAHYLELSATGGTKIDVWGGGASAIDNDTWFATPSPDDLIGTPHVMAARFNLQTPRWDLRIDGVLHSTATINQLGPLSEIDRIDYPYPGNLARSFKGSLGVLFVFNGDLSDTDVAAVEDYLLSRYGLS